jgi:hypothetical protein
MEKYTTQAKLDKIKNDKEITQEAKQKEEEKEVLSSGDYALTEAINNLINKIEHARLSFIR